MRFSLGFGLGPLRASQSIGMPRIDGRRVGGAYRELNEASQEISGMWFDALEARTADPRGPWDLFVGTFMLGLTTAVTAFAGWFFAYIAWELSGWWWLAALFMLPAGLMAIWLLVYVVLVIPWEITGRLPWQSRSTPPHKDSMKARRAEQHARAAWNNALQSDEPFLPTYVKSMEAKAEREQQARIARQTRAQEQEGHLGARRESEPINRSEPERATPRVVKIEEPKRSGPSLPLMLGAAAVLVAASIGGTLWLTRDDSGTEGDGGLEPTSMADWLNELSTTGLNPRNPQLLWEHIKSDTCTNDDYSLYVTLNRSMSLNQERIGIKHACPDRLDDWDAAVVNLGDVNDRVDFLCETPLEQLSLDEGDDGISDREEAMIVCDQYQGREWRKYYNDHFAP